MTKKMYWTVCWCMVLIGMEAPVLIDASQRYIPPSSEYAQVAKRYYIAEKIWTLPDMRKADALNQSILQNKFEEINEADPDLLKVLIRGNKEEAVTKLITERNIMPNLDALQEAIVYRRNSLALFFIDCVKSLAKEQNNIGTVLHIASLFNNLEVAKLLLDHKIIDVNATNQYQDTPLHLAARQGYHDMVTFLCDNGANPFKLNQRKFNRHFDAMDVAYRHMQKMCSPKERSCEVPARMQHYCDILHVLYQYVGKFGGSAQTVYVH